MSSDNSGWRERIAVGSQLHLIACLEEDRLPDPALVGNLWHAHYLNRRGADEVNPMIGRAWRLLAAARTQFHRAETQKILQRCFELTISPDKILPEVLRAKKLAKRTSFSDSEIFEIRELRERAEWIWADISGPLQRASQMGQEEPYEKQLTELARATHQMLVMLTKHIDTHLGKVLANPILNENYSVSSGLTPGAPKIEKFLRPLLRGILKPGETFLFACGATWRDRAVSTGHGSYQGYFVITDLGIRYCFNEQPRDVKWDISKVIFVAAEEFEAFTEVLFYSTVGSMTVANAKGVRIDLIPGQRLELASLAGEAFILNHIFDKSDSIGILTGYSPRKDYTKVPKRLW